MIPLSSWLAPEAPDLIKAPAAALPDSLEPCETMASESPDQIAEAYEKGLLEGRSDLLAAVEGARQEERERAAQREAELEADWARRCSGELATLVQSEFLLLRQHLESALVDVLAPFLMEGVASRVQDSLSSLLLDILRDEKDAALEVRCPAPMLDMISSALGERGFRVPITEATEIEVITHAGSRRLAVLTESWLASIRNSRHE